MGSYLRPASLDAALDALAECPRTVLAGGTDHFPARVTATPDEDLLDISALADLRAITRAEGHIRIPCLATWSDLIAATLPPALDALKQAARQVGGVQVQNAGTLLGNVCNASPAADGMPPLLALNAEVELASVAGRRVVKLADFVTGPRRTLRRPDELAVALRIAHPSGPHPFGDARSCFLKLGARRYLVISIAMVAAVAEFSADGRIAAIRIAVGACSPVAMRLPDLEAALAGQFPDPSLVRPEHLSGLTPIDDVRATAAYRHIAALELTRRAVAGLADMRAAA
jgi:CO/xanthine dehydrogenase FAD-binding subunit